MIKRSTPWTSQPQTPVGIDWGNPLTNGLIFASTGDINACNNAVLVGAGALGVAPFGKTRVFDGSSTGFSSTLTTSSSIASVTFVALAYPTNTTATNTLLGIGTGVAGKYIALDLSGSEVNDPLRVVYNGTGAGSVYYSNPPYNAWSLFGGVANPGGTNRLYIDGERLSPSSHTSAGNFPSGVNVNLGKIYTFTDGNRFAGSIAFSAVWVRGLSNWEMQSLYLNPWQIFAPQQRNIYVSVAAGGDVSVNVTGVTGTTGLGTATVTAIQNASTSVTGLTGTSALGTVSVLTGGSVDANVTGVTGTTGLGTATVTAIQNASASVAGLTGTTGLGSVTVDVGGSVSASVTGVTGTASLGTVSVTAVRVASVSVTGVTGTSALGTASVTIGSSADVSVSVTGVTGTTGLGRVLVWGLIDTSQTPNWVRIAT